MNIFRYTPLWIAQATESPASTPDMQSVRSLPSGWPITLFPPVLRLNICSLSELMLSIPTPIRMGNAFQSLPSSTKRCVWPLDQLGNRQIHLVAVLNINRSVLALPSSARHRSICSVRFCCAALSGRSSSSEKITTFLEISVAQQPRLLAEDRVSAVVFIEHPFIQKISPER